MGRKSKLTETQWLEIERQMLEGVPVRVLARQYGVSETAIRKRKSLPIAEIKSVADQLVSAQQALSALPISSQITAQTLAHKLLALSDNLLGAAMNGAATSHRLHAIANAESLKIDDASPLASMESIKAVGVLTEVANKAALVGMNLVAANKDKVLVPEQPNTPTGLDFFYGGS